jgi:cell division protein FtsL
MSTMFDKFGNYDLVVMVLFAVLVFCALLFVTMGKQPVQAVVESDPSTT